MDNYRKRISTLKMIILIMFAVTVFVTLQFDYGMMELAINTVFLAAMALMTRYALQHGLDQMNAYTRDIETMIRELEDSKDDCGGDREKLEARVLGVDTFIENQDMKEHYEAYCEAYRRKSAAGCNITDFLNFDQLTENLSVRFCQILPGLMTAMGILGTFLGLAIGLTNFDFSSSQSLGESIQIFISGINIAFYTSIYGIVISIYMNSFYNSVEERFEEKLMKLEKCFDKLGMNQSEQSMWARLYEEERSQTRSLDQLNKEFASHLADVLGERLSKSFNMTNSNIQNLMGQIHERENSALEQMAGSFLKNLNSSIQSDYASMAETVGNLEKNFQTLGESVGYLSQWQKEMTDEIRKFVAEVSESNRRMEELTVQNMEQMRRFHDTLQGFSSSMEQAEGINEKLSRYQEESQCQLQQMESLTKELKREQEKQKEDSIDLKWIQQEIKLGQEKINYLLDQINELEKKENNSKEAERIHEVLKSLSGEIEETEKHLLDAIENTTLRGKIRSFGSLFNKEKEA
nr:MotA/TolQ/ExbB proton channel family protein [uncultured Anaerostipes sp.]